MGLRILEAGDLVSSGSEEMRCRSHSRPAPRVVTRQAEVGITVALAVLNMTYSHSTIIVIELIQEVFMTYIQDRNGTWYKTYRSLKAQEVKTSSPGTPWPRVA